MIGYGRWEYLNYDISWTMILVEPAFENIGITYASSKQMVAQD